MIQLHLLGEVALARAPDSGPVSLLGEPTRFAILVYIAASRHTYGCREELKRLFWPDSPRHRAQNALRQSLHRIRERLGADCLISKGTRLEVNPEVLQVDVARFEAALREGRRREALRLYGGALLSGFPSIQRREFDDWVQARRLQLTRAALTAAAELANSSESAGDYADAAHWWRLAVNLSPYDEVNLRRWMCALALEGAPGRALKVYRDAARQLEREFETVPAGATRALAQQIRRGDDPLSLESARI